MKKNLLFSIGMLCLAILTVCGVSFAYFFSKGDSGSQSVTLDNYEFRVESTVVQTLPSLYFRAPTIINFPAVQAPVFDTAAYETMTDAEKAAYTTQYNEAMNLFKRRGDDAMFDVFGLPLLVSAVNDSMATMRFSYEIKATATAASTVNVAPALRFFVFDREQTQKLIAGGAQEGQYAAAMHAVCDALDAGAETDAEKITEARLSAGNLISSQSLSRDVYYHGETAQTLIFCWLDYTKVRQILYDVNGGADMGDADDNNVGAYRKYALDVSVSVTAENSPSEGGAV